MVTGLHLISGLPSSGFTLLCALPRQNSRLTAAMISPVASLCSEPQKKMCGGEFGVFFDDATRAAMLRGAFGAHYTDIDSGRIAFDTNRT